MTAGGLWIVIGTADYIATKGRLPNRKTGHAIVEECRIPKGLLMSNAIEVRAPDGLICQVVHSARGFSPIRWNAWMDGSIYVPREPSAGLKAHAFSTAHAAMMAAYRERLQQEQAIKSLGEEGVRPTRRDER
jgi:hypothetical protein